jgi:hypothetical protein
MGSILDGSNEGTEDLQRQSRWLRPCAKRTNSKLLTRN